MIKKFSRFIISSGVIVSILLGATFMSFATGLESFTSKKVYRQEVFKDIKDTDWFYKDVKEAYELGLVSGKGKNEFNPLGKVTIAEAIMLAATINSQYAGEDIVSKEGKWYEGAVEYAKNHDIISDNKLTDYELFATRAEVAYILSNSLPNHELKDINNIDKIPDVKSSDKYKENIFKLYNSGIIRGTGVEGSFKPNDYISRAEIASLVNRLVKPKNRVKFELGEILYKNDKYGFSISIPRMWEEHYKIRSSMFNGYEVLHFDLMKDGKKLISLFNLMMVPTNEYNFDSYLTIKKVGTNREHVILTERAHDMNAELMKVENINGLNLYWKMMNEDHDKIINSIKFY